MRKFLLEIVVIAIFVSSIDVVLGEGVDEELDATNQYIANQWKQLNQNVDTFFSNQRYSFHDNKSSLFIYSSFYKKEGNKIEKEYDFQLKIDLPKTAKKLKIVIEKEQNEIGQMINGNTNKNLNTPAKSNTKNGNKNKTKYTAGISYLLKQSKYFSSFMHFGIRLDVPINPYAKLSLKKDITLKYINIGLLQQLIMYRQEGLQEISQLSFDRKWNRVIQTSLINSLAWTDETDLFILRNNFVLYQKVGEEKGLTYSLGANAKFTPEFNYDSYDLSIGYRQILYSKWLYGSFSVGADYPKQNNFKNEKFVQARLEVYFKE